MDWMEWYQSLHKPAWTPAPAIIGLIWNVLYPVIAISFGYVFVRAILGKLPWSVAAPFAVNLAANLAFTPIMFGLRNIPLATADILLVWATIVWMVIAVWKHSRVIAIAQAPYFVWVSIATALQVSILLLNTSR